MRFDVEIGGLTRHVAVVRTGDGFAVTVDGRTFQIDVARIDGQTLSLLVDTVWLDDRSLTPGLTPSQTPGLTPGQTASQTVRLRSVLAVSLAPRVDGMPTVR